MLDVIKITVVAWLTVVVCTALAGAGVWYLQDSNSSTQANNRCMAELQAQGIESLRAQLCE